MTLTSGLFDKNGIELEIGHTIYKKLKEEHKWKKGYFECPSGDMIITGDYYMEGQYRIGFENGSFGTITDANIFHPLFPNYDHWDIEVVKA